MDPDNYSPKVIEELKAAAPSLSIELSFVSARTPEDFGPAFSAISRAHSQAVYLVENGVFFAHRATLLKLATNARLPIIYGEKHFGLFSYGRTGTIISADRPGTWIGSSRGPSQPTCRSSNLPRLSWSSTSRTHAHSASRCPSRPCCARMR
jgi:hypothetical protein